MQRTAATRTVSGGSFADLNEDLLGDETLVAYAAAGTTAADGRGRNSPYTAALLSHLETPLEIGLLFRRVRAQVLAATNGAQRPHEYHSLVGEHYLTRTLATGASTTVSAVSAAIPAEPAPVDPPRPDPPEIDIPELHVTGLRELAEAGDAEAQTELGERYEHGRGVDRTTPLPCPGSGERLNKAMPARGLPLASCTAQGAVWNRTTRKRSGGIALRPSRERPRAAQPRRQLPRRSWGVTGRRERRVLVPSSGRTGIRRGADRPRPDVQHRQRGVAGLRDGRLVV